MGEYDSGHPTSVLSHELTDGVDSVLVTVAGIADEGGIALFDYNVVTLWGENALTVLDVNIFDDEYLSM
jgi:hypothetical protein